MKYPTLATSLISRINQRFFLEYQILRQGIIEINGIKVRLKSDLSRIILKALCYKYYEFEEMQILELKLSKDDVVMELGAGIGLTSSYCAKKIGSERVFTYEANPMMKENIYDTYRINQVHPKLEICLLGEEDGETGFYVEKDFWISSTIQNTQQAKFITVDLKSFNKKIYSINPTFLILDIEGGEYELLKFADLYNVQKILIETHSEVIGSEKVEFVREKLFQSGFHLNEQLSAKDVSFWQR